MRKGRLTALRQDASVDKIMTADAATLRISNQKNGYAGTSVHHWAVTNDPGKCPVQALGHRIVHIRQNSTSSNALLCAFWDEI